MKKFILPMLLLFISLSLYGNEIYFTKDRSDRLACKIAHSIKETYPKKTMHDLREEILAILQADINPWVDAYPIPAGLSLPIFMQKITGLPGFPMSRAEYYLQNAFILYGNPQRELKEPTLNYFASFIHLARTRHIAYLNQEAPKFQLRSEANLINQIEDHLPYVANYAYPYLDSNGQPIMQKIGVVNEKSRFKLAIGIPNHKEYNQFVYESQKYNEFSSPLFLWLLKQENFSVTPEKIFDKAMEIYGNPIVALGVIPWIFSGDALTVNRGTSSVVSYKMEKLVKGKDIPGLQYHFWGYLTQGMIGNKIRVGTLSYIYEQLYQNDFEERSVDALSLKFSDQIRASFKSPDQCPNE